MCLWDFVQLIVLWLLVWTYSWKVCLILQCRCIVVHEYIFAHLLCVHMSLWMRVKPCNSFIFWLQAQEKNRRTLLKQTNTQAGTVGAMKLDAESAYCPLFLDFPPITLLLILEFWAHYFRLMFNLILFFCFSPILSFLADYSSAFPLILSLTEGPVQSQKSKHC